MLNNIFQSTLPPIPDTLIADTVAQLYACRKSQQAAQVAGHGSFAFSKNRASAIHNWLGAHIGPAHWNIMFFVRDQPWHRDPRTAARFFFLLDPGGPAVRTEFGSRYEKETLESVTIPTGCWHLLNTSVYHRVCGVEPGRLRIILTCRLFGYAPIDYPQK